MYDLMDGSKRVVADLKELSALTSTQDGAQRVAWTPTWQIARNWFAEKATEAGAIVSIDQAGNSWAKIEGQVKEAVVVGSHLDCVPDGGWLDGALGVVVALEALRRYGRAGEKPYKTLYAVSWADEEGARFGSSLMGSSACTGSLNIDEIKNRIDNEGVSLVEALAKYNVSLETMLEARDSFRDKNITSALELHIEQGPVLESKGKSVACVYGVTGVERYQITFEGQPAHAGSFPTLMRQDAFLAAAQSALAFKEIALKYNGVCTVGKVRVYPDVVTIFPGTCVMSLDQRSIDKETLEKMFEEAKLVSEKAAADQGVTVKWEKIYATPPTQFDTQLNTLCKLAVEEETGEDTSMFSGPLHDAVEMAKVVPTTMMFAMSEGGLSHCKEENTNDQSLEIAIRAFLRLVEKTLQANQQ